jgi:hypothetical protein
MKILAFSITESIHSSENMLQTSGADIDGP